MPKSFCNPKQKQSNVKLVRGQPTGQGTPPEEISKNCRPEITEVKSEVKRSHTKTAGIYIEGKVQDVNVVFTVDTGASRTILSEKIYDKIKLQKPPLTKSSMIIHQANGEPIKGIKCAKFDFEIGPLKLEKEVCVGDIQDDILLGMDMLSPRDGSVADILQSKNIIK